MKEKNNKKNLTLKLLVIFNLLIDYLMIFILCKSIIYLLI
jgi:hypothetical protein